MGARRNLETTFLRLPLRAIRNAVLSSVFHVHGDEVSVTVKSDVTNNIFHHILQFTKCFNPVDLDGPKSVPMSPPGITNRRAEEGITLS